MCACVCVHIMVKSISRIMSEKSYYRNAEGKYVVSMRGARERERVRKRGRGKETTINELIKP